ASGNRCNDDRDVYVVAVWGSAAFSVASAGVRGLPLSHRIEAVVGSRIVPHGQKRRPTMRLSSVLFLATLSLLAAPAPTAAQAYSVPIIDVHMHVGAAAPGAPNPATGQPTTANTDADRQRLTLERMRRHGIILGLVSGPDAAMASMRKSGGEDLIWAGAFLDDGRTPLPPAEVLREAFANGDLKVMGEIGAQYHGLDPSDEWFEPYLALAEEFDIPVGIHTGLAPPGTPYGCCPDFSVSLGNPLRLEPMLKRHPKLRVWMAH